MFRVLNCGRDQAEWDKVLSAMPYDCRDLHFTSAYGRAQENGEDRATSHLAVWDSEDQFVRIIQPFLMRPAGDGWNDVTAVGYGGPLAMGPLVSRAEAHRFDMDKLAWFAANRVVAEFYLVNPILAEAQWIVLPPDGDRVAEKSVVIVPAGANWPGMRKAREHALAKIAADPRAATDTMSGAAALEYAEAFYRLYVQAMDRKGASPRWRVQAGYIRSLFHELVTDDARADLLWTTTIEGAASEANAAAIFAYGRAAAYYMLAATSGHPPQGLSDRNIARAMSAAEERSIPWLHLGGGVTSRTDDSLLRYKASFGGLTRVVYSIRRIIKPSAYRQLCERAKVPFHAQFFPAYRAHEAEPAA